MRLSIYAIGMLFVSYTLYCMESSVESCQASQPASNLITLIYRTCEDSFEKKTIPEEIAQQSSIIKKLLCYCQETKQTDEPIVDISHGPSFSQKEMEIVIACMELQKECSQAGSLYKKLRHISDNHLHSIEHISRLLIHLDYLSVKQVFEKIRYLFIQQLKKPEILQQIINPDFFKNLGISEALQAHINSQWHYSSCLLKNNFPLHCTIWPEKNFTDKIKKIFFNGDSFYQVRWNAAGEYLAVQKYPYNGIQYIKDGTLLPALEQGRYCKGVCWNTSGEQIAGLLSDNILLTVNLNDAKHPFYTQITPLNKVTAFTWGPGEYKITYGLKDGYVGVLGTTIGENLTIDEEEPIKELAWNAKQAMLSIVVANFLYIANSKGIIKKYPAYTSALYQTKWNPIHKNYLACITKIGNSFIQILNVKKHTSKEFLSTHVENIAWNPTGNWLLSHGRNNELYIHTKEGKLIRTLSLEVPIVSLDWSKEDTIALASSKNISILYMKPFTILCNEYKNLSLQQKALVFGLMKNKIEHNELVYNLLPEQVKKAIEEYKTNKHIPKIQYPPAQTILNTILGTK